MKEPSLGSETSAQRKPDGKGWAVEKLHGLFWVTHVVLLWGKIVLELVHQLATKLGSSGMQRLEGQS